MTMRAYLVDDEPLAIKRLSRLLNATRRVEIVGTSTDPLEAVAGIQKHQPDVVFLDIQMPEMSGFDVLAKLDPQPFVVFTTAHDAFALKAFEVNSVDYLLKPIEKPLLERALNKLERMRNGNNAKPDIRALLHEVAASMGNLARSGFLERLPSRLGDRVELVDIRRVTHFFANEKLTFAATPGKNYVVNFTIQALEDKLDPANFVRIHRSTIVALKNIQELHPWFAGRMRIRLNDERHTDLDVARDRVKALKEKLGMGE
jgi:two-component system, LytTR family, response regulator